MLGALSGETAVYHLLAGHQVFALKVVFEQPSLLPQATCEPRRLDVEKIVLGVYANITWVYVITSICGHHCPAGRRIAHNNLTARNLGANHCDLRSIAECQVGVPLTRVRDYARVSRKRNARSSLVMLNYRSL